MFNFTCLRAYVKVKRATFRVMCANPVVFPPVNGGSGRADTQRSPSWRNSGLTPLCLILPGVSHALPRLGRPCPRYSEANANANAVMQVQQLANSE